VSDALEGEGIPTHVIEAFKRLLKRHESRPFPCHLFNESSYELFIGSAEPATRPYLTIALLRAISEQARFKYRHIFDAVERGVQSTSDMIGYMDQTGILERLGTPPQEAGAILARLSSARIDELQLPSRDRLVKYCGSGPPEAPVRFRAEFEPVDAVTLSFPIYYPGEWETHAQIINEIQAVARVLILIPNEYWQRGVMLYLMKKRIPVTRVRFILLASDDVWIRDYAPTVVFAGREQRPVALWNHYFEAYAPHRKFDADVGLNLGPFLDLPVHRLPLIIEGGNLVCDGHGTMVMFSSILNQNPDISKSKIETLMREYFGCERLLLFPPLGGELTGHIDMAVKFVDPETVLVASGASGSKWHSDFEKIANTFSDTMASTGRPYRVVRVQNPDPEADDGCFHSYVNSLIVNNKILVPTFGHLAHDERALCTYRDVAKGKTVTAVPCHGYPSGSIHCLTKEIPREA